MNQCLHMPSNYVNDLLRNFSAHKVSQITCTRLVILFFYTSLLSKSSLLKPWRCSKCRNILLSHLLRLPFSDGLMLSNDWQRRCSIWYPINLRIETRFFFFKEARQRFAVERSCHDEIDQQNLATSRSHTWLHFHSSGPRAVRRITLYIFIQFPFLHNAPVVMISFYSGYFLIKGLSIYVGLYHPLEIDRMTSSTCVQYNIWIFFFFFWNFFFVPIEKSSERGKWWKSRGFTWRTSVYFPDS